MAVVVLALLLPLASALVDSTDVEEEGVDIVIPSGCRADNYLLGQHIEEAYPEVISTTFLLHFFGQAAGHLLP